MIKGISDVRRLPRLGKIRLGEKKISANSGKQYPSKLDHFNFKDVPEVAAVYGDNCKEMDIILPVENQDVFFSQERKAYRLTGLFCKSADGDTATRVRVGVADGSNPKVPKGTVLDPDGEAFIKEQGIECGVGEMFELPCPGEGCPFTENKMCKPIGRLLFMLPKVPKFGCYEISTTSFNSMVELNSYLEAIRGIAGRVSMIPLKLLLVPKQVQVDGKATGIFHLKIAYPGTITDLMKFRENKALPAPLPAAALPAPQELDKHAPEDLMPEGGAVLEDALGGKVPEKPNPADIARANLAKTSVPAPEPPAEEAPSGELFDDPPAQEDTLPAPPPAAVRPLKPAPAKKTLAAAGAKPKYF